MGKIIKTRSFTALLACLLAAFPACSGKTILTGDGGVDGDTQMRAWARIYGGPSDERARCVIQTGDGGYMVAGWTDSYGAGNRDIWLLRLNREGDLVWQKAFGGPGRDEPFEVVETSDGGFVVAGETTSFGMGNSDGWILNIDGSGNMLWQTSYGDAQDDGVASIIETSEGKFVAAGGTESVMDNTFDLWVLKLERNGAVEWQKTYEYNFSNQAFSIDRTSDGGFIIAGQIALSGMEPPDIWILKLDPDGNVAWQKRFGGDGDDRAESVRQTSDGGYIVAGRSESFGEGDANAWVMRLEANGSAAWEKIYGLGPINWAESIQPAAGGGFIVAGGTGASEAGPWNDWILKVDREGEILWQKKFNNNGNSYSQSVRQTFDGGYVSAGWTISSTGSYDIWVLKLDANGNISTDCPPDLIIETSAEARAVASSSFDTSISPEAASTSASETNGAAVDSTAQAETLCSL